MKRVSAFAIILLLGVSCADIFLEKDPESTPENNFEIFWDDYNQYYSFFELKKLNWDSIYQVKRIQISPETTEAQLTSIFNDMIQYLRDGHAYLRTSKTKYYYYDFWSKYPVNKLSSVSGYVSLTRVNANISTGIIQNDIGYIAINSFGGKESDYKAIDGQLKNFLDKNVKGLIIDIRGNGGGSDNYSRLIANRFTDQRRIYSYYRYKAGPARNDFEPWNEKTIGPDGTLFLKPIALLTNRNVFSSAEDFVLAMKSIPTVKMMGDTTGGGSGNPLVRHLPNGWSFAVPRWQQVDYNFNFYEGTGIVPHIPIWISADNINAGRDTILERALEELRK